MLEVVLAVLLGVCVIAGTQDHRQVVESRGGKRARTYAQDPDHRLPDFQPVYYTMYFIIAAVGWGCAG